MSRPTIPIRSCPRCGKRFPSWHPTKLCGACLSAPYDAPAVTAPKSPPAGASAADARGQLTLVPTDARRSGSQWLELPGTTWEDIFYPPDESAA